mmetsp:Transcript_26837/g.46599  ORF Transcript_26837/g.46599 Transcript_26837/m.46599 type:complete len:656 (-) Transcript_26837:93-2060(-)
MNSRMSSTVSSAGAHQAKMDFVTRHKVIKFGKIFRSPISSREEEKAYWCRHQRQDLKISEFVVPVGFLSKMILEEGQPIFLETKAGEKPPPVKEGEEKINEEKKKEDPNAWMGPRYRVKWKKDDVIGNGWNSNLDELWTAVLTYFELKKLLSPDMLDYLDADPFVLFGIDDQITQQALRKLENRPALMCEGSGAPTFEEWREYLRIDPRKPEDENNMWLVQALMETELPKPWTCYKGVGSIVCYIRSDVGAVTWKHPFYEYFRQLRDFCRQASALEVMQVRVNRLLWSYEATRVETEHYQEPLVSPEYVEKLALIFGHNVAEQGCLVRNLKAQLKVFAKSYREKQDIDINDVDACAKTLEKDGEKYDLMREEWESPQGDVTFELTELANGQKNCVNCEKVALSFCLECKDYLCLNCYDTLHRNGARRDHAPFRLVPCKTCNIMPAKLHCTFTDKSLCHECYAMKHIKLLPPDGKENQPRQINYKTQYVRYATYAKERQQQAARERQQAQIAASKSGLALGNLPGTPEPEESYDSVLSTDWHPFYDSRGVKYYHNFSTGERMRQSPRRVPNTNDAGAAEDGEENGDDVGSPAAIMNSTRDGMFATMSSINGAGSTLSLSGFDALKTDMPSAKGADPDLRTLRVPHRKHMPMEVAAG